MRLYLLAPLFCIFFSINALAQNALQQIESADYESAEAGLRAALERAPEAADAHFGLARLYGEPGYARYNPDTAYTFLRNAQRYYRKLSKGRQKKLDQQEMGAGAMRSLKSELREKGLEFALEKGRSEALLQYMEHYKRLNQESESRAMAAFLALRLEELQQLGRYDSLKNFALVRESDLREYQPELMPALQDAIFAAFFSERDSTRLEDLFVLLKDYPPAARRLDAPLSAALWKKPLITRAEGFMRGADHRYLPRTIEAVYYYHFITGEWSDLVGFQNRYPEYVDSFNLPRAFTVARLAPDLKIGYTDDRKEAYEHYIELAAPVQKAFTALQQLIARDLEAERWEDAIATVERFSPYFGEEDPRVLGLKEILQRPLEGLEPLSLGEAVNTYLGEYSPVVSADGQRLLFCRNQGNNEDIYMAERQEQGWGEAMAVEALNTTESHEAPLALSADGTTLLMYDGGIVKFTNKTREGWSAPRNFFSEANTPDWQGTTAFAANREAVILAARTFDVVGARNDDNIDLFVSFRQPDGSWGAPVNLGPTLNTPFEDRSPFLHPDMRTLYFSSSGHGGLGKLDVFVTTRIGDGWLDWTPPVNLGKEINGPGNDWGYRITTDGATAYFSGGVFGGKEDLFQVGVPEKLRPQPVSTISGRLAGLNGRPVAATIVLADLNTGEEVGIAEPDPETGAYFITLPSGKLYSYTIRGEGMYPTSNNIDLRESTTGIAVKENITVPTIREIQEGGITLSLKNLFFDTDQYNIRPESYTELNRLAALVKTYGLTVEIAGHTDNVGTPAYNLELSQNRAKAARSYLLAQGCAPEQVTARGYGLSQPIADNDSEEGRAQNRRVEIRFRGVNE
ncbi:MAG: OmpA family protein [Phaeodactylibacter sp.]|nr:OmpA family protein [Phaeodactylibacter sp.]